MNTEAQRRAHKAYVERLKADGGRAVTLRLSRTAYEMLEALAKMHGSQTAAIEAVLTEAGSRIAAVALRQAKKPEPAEKAPAGYQVPLASTIERRAVQKPIKRGK